MKRLVLLADPSHWWDASQNPRLPHADSCSHHRAFATLPPVTDSIVEVPVQVTADLASCRLVLWSIKR
jgi:hypothetical protein